MTRNLLFASAASLLCLTGIAAAQTASPSAPAATSAPVDPARLAAAQQLIAVMMPPEQREQLVENMIRPMMANARNSLQRTPGFAGMIGGDSKRAAAFENFMKAQEERTVETIRVGMPGMIEAMARAYARNFDARQLAEIRAFFETPTGRIYMSRVTTIMSDPDIQAWQRDLMARSMMHVQEDIAKFVADLSASQSSEQK